VVNDTLFKVRLAHAVFWSALHSWSFMSDYHNLFFCLTGDGKNISLSSRG
jgi:hypothetical protein